MSKLITAFFLCIAFLTSTCFGWRDDSYFQTTLAREVTFSGTGLYTRNDVTVTLKPSEADTGLSFKRTDLGPNTPLIPALWKHIVSTEPTTTLGLDDVNKVFGFEHLMATLYALGIDNAVIEVNAKELPIGNGTTLDYIKNVFRAGVVNLKHSRQIIKIIRSISLRTGNSQVSFLPSRNNTLYLNMNVTTAHPALTNEQTLALKLSSVNFLNELSYARPTAFVNASETTVEGYAALGVTFHNAWQYDQVQLLNNEFLGLHDNLVRHQTVLCLSDLALLGAPLIGEFTAKQPDRALMQELVCALMEDRIAWKYCDAAHL